MADTHPGRLIDYHDCSTEPKWEEIELNNLTRIKHVQPMSAAARRAGCFKTGCFIVETYNEMEAYAYSPKFEGYFSTLDDAAIRCGSLAMEGKSTLGHLDLDDKAKEQAKEMYEYTIYAIESTYGDKWKSRRDPVARN